MLYFLFSTQKPSDCSLQYALIEWNLFPLDITIDKDSFSPSFINFPKKKLWRSK